MSQQEWEYVGKQLTIREKAGKKSEVYFNNELITEKKLRKEISRHVLPKFISGE